MTYHTPEEMVRSLVTYMSDCKAVRSAVLAEFTSCPSVPSIAALRGAWLRGKAREGREKQPANRNGEAVTKQDCEEIFALFLSGMTFPEIGQRFGFSDYTAKEIVKTFTGDMLPDEYRRNHQAQRAADIAGLARDVFNTPPGLIFYSRKREVTQARFAAWRVASEHGLRSSCIGMAFGTDHSTVIKGARQAEILANYYPEYAVKLNLVREMALEAAA